MGPPGKCDEGWFTGIYATPHTFPLPAFAIPPLPSDRADREHDEQTLLIFDPDTGQLLAHELLTLKPKRISTYLLILATDRTDHLG